MTIASPFSYNPHSPAFGGRIRELRRKGNMTLQALAEQAGISVGFLSQVERDKATPSLTTLGNLATALGVDIEVFISSPKPAESLTRAGDRPLYSLTESDLQYERLSTVLPGGQMTSLIVHVPPGYQSEPLNHVGEEFLTVLQGQITQTLGDASLVLNEGDSLHFMGDTRHSFANRGDAPARVLWVGTTNEPFGRSNRL